MRLRRCGTKYNTAPWMEFWNQKKETSEKMSEILIKYEVHFIAMYRHQFLCSDNVPW